MVAGIRFYRHPIKVGFVVWCLLVVLTALGLHSVRAETEAETNLWQQAAVLPSKNLNSQAWVQPDRFLLLKLNHPLLLSILKGSHKENANDAAILNSFIQLPMPDGTLARFNFFDSQLLPPELAAQFPEIKTYVGRGVNNPRATVRFDLTPSGFHAQILSPTGAVYIDPYPQGNTNLYASYFKRDYHRLTEDFQCLTSEDPTAPKPAVSAPLVVSGGSIRTYRLACAATGEYTQFHGGTVAGGLAAIATAINRVNGVYETEMGIRFVLVNNNNLLVYTNFNTDPYTGSNPTLLLSQNQSNLDYVIGNANYDIGHVFSTAGGGRASVGVVCITGIKARGETGIYPPTGDAFWIDYVAHEIGHQLGAYHTFNSTNSACNGNRSSSTAYEPGSGSTIMSYSGLCGEDNLQPHSDPYFHSASLDQMTAFIESTSTDSYPTVLASGNNPPSASAGPNFSIPIGTPFELTAMGSDPDGDLITWCWEERDLGPCILVTDPDNGSSPLFRSFAPTTSPGRTFPQVSAILNNVSSRGETLPMTARTMNFRVTARDNRLDGGGVSSSDMQVAVVANAGPFRITSPNTPVSWSGYQIVSWNVAGTTNFPINTMSVNILLSTDGGQSFPIVLASNVPNSGNQTVLLPNIITSAARIKIQAAANVYFDISRTNFSIFGGSILPMSAPLVIRSLNVSNGIATIKWDAAQAGQYRLQWTDALDIPIWHDSAASVAVDETGASAAEYVGDTPHRFYRIARLP